MGRKLLTLGALQLLADDEWYETTDQVEVPEPPFTLTRNEGCGALQFTIGMYRSGRVPNPSPATLLEMARECGAAEKLSKASNEVAESTGHLNIGAVSYDWDRDFVRVWYISDGMNFVMATYTCGRGEEQLEL